MPRGLPSSSKGWRPGAQAFKSVTHRNAAIPQSGSSLRSPADLVRSSQARLSEPPFRGQVPTGEGLLDRATPPSVVQAVLEPRPGAVWYAARQHRHRPGSLLDQLGIERPAIAGALRTHVARAVRARSVHSAALCGPESPESSDSAATPGSPFPFFTVLGVVASELQPASGFRLTDINRRHARLPRSLVPAAPWSALPLRPFSISLSSSGV